MFRIAICEDEKVVLDFESSLIKEWAADKLRAEGCHLVLDTFISAEQFLFESEDKPPYDVLIFDIQMKNMNGMELAKTLRKRGCDSVIIFVTGVPDYAIEGYEVGAIRYILKPLKSESFFALLDSVYEQCQKKHADFFVLSQGGDIERIPYEKIVYFEARGHYVFIKGTDFEREWKSSFSDVVASLTKTGGSTVVSGRTGGESDEKKDGAGDTNATGRSPVKTSGRFFCLRRGLLVNLSHVSRITRIDCVLDNGEELPVARGVYKELNDAFIQYFKS